MKTYSKLTFLTWVFLVANAIYAVGFVLSGFADFLGVSKSSLYTSQNETWHALPEVWGIVNVVAVISSIYFHYHDNRTLGYIGCVLGLGSWAFASLVYLQTGFILVFFTVGLLYLSFWLHFYFKYISDVDLEGINLKSLLYRK